MGQREVVGFWLCFERYFPKSLLPQAFVFTYMWTPCPPPPHLQPSPLSSQHIHSAAVDPGLEGLLGQTASTDSLP